MIGGSGSHLVKCQRIGKKNKKKQKKKQQQHVSTRFQADDGYAERFNRRIAYALEQRKASGLEHRPNRSRCDRIFLEEEGFVVPSLHRYVKEFNREKAEKALELYEKSQVSEFEIVQVFYSHGAKIAHPEPKKAKQVWSHVSFTAKPKNVECSGGGGDASPKHFFGELLRDDLSQEFNAMYCSTFEPSHDPVSKGGGIITFG